MREHKQEPAAEIIKKKKGKEKKKGKTLIKKQENKNQTLINSPSYKDSCYSIKTLAHDAFAVKL